MSHLGTVKIDIWQSHPTEATAQLDGLTEAAIQDAIAAAATRASVVTIAHRLSTVLDAHRIVVLDSGQIRAVGTHTELLATDRLYADLVAAPRIAHVEHPNHATTRGR